MSTLLDAPQPPAAAHTRRLFRGYLTVALFLAGLLGATWLLQVVQVTRVEASAERRQREAVAEAFAQIEARFTALQEEMLVEARTLAVDPVLMQGLRQRQDDGLDVQNGTGHLVAYAAALTPGDRSAIELYDGLPRLVAWKGFSMGLDAAPATPRFGEAYQTATVQDGDLRQALVLWHPVRDGTRALGAVRVLRLLNVQTPVQNRYLRDYRIEEIWSRMTGLAVRVQLFGGSGTAAEALLEPSRPLRGIDGTLLGSVSVEPPTAEALVEAVEDRFHHVLAFWATLALLWAVAGAWVGYQVLSRTDVGDGARLLRAAAGFTVWGVAWWGVRYALLALDVPARWQSGRAPLNPLFDPTHLASSTGSGLLRSMGDLLLTAFFTLVFAIALVAFAARFRQRAVALYRFHRRSKDRGVQPRGRLGRSASILRFLGLSALTAAAFVGLVALLAVATRYAVLDSTLDYFARTGLWPEDLAGRLRLIVFCALLVLAASVVLSVIGSGWIAGWALLRYRPTHGSLARWALLAVPMEALSVAGLYLLFGVQQVLPWPVLLLFLALALLSFVLGLERQGSVWALFSLRGVLLALFGVTLVFYPLLYQGMNEQRYLRMQDAAEAFGEGNDPQVVYAIREVVQDVVRAPEVAAVVALPGTVEGRQAHLDSAASSFLHGSLLTSLNTYDVSLTFFDRTGVPVGRHYESEGIYGRAMLDTADAQNLSVLRQIYQEGSPEGITAVPLTGRRETSRFQYAGIAPLYEQAGRFGFVGWVMARAEPQDLLSLGGSAFPRLLTPSGTTDLYADLSLAEFRDGVLVRSFGRDFGRYRLAAGVQQALRTQPEVWQREAIKGQRYLTYYRRPSLRSFGATGPGPFRAASLQAPTVAVRVPALIAFDHLFYLLRLMIAGLFVAVPLYAVGVYGRWQAGLLPPPRTRYRDRVLNAFLGVGLVSVVMVGIVGLRAIQQEDARDVRSGLQQNLDRVEEALARGARGEMPYRALSRIDVDSLAAQVGLDLNVYRREALISSSRPDLVRERLINDRLPIEAYHALYFDGYRFTVAQEQAGDFAYTVGFKAIPDERGRPGYVISTATLPEQERIEEERSRTVAYLFGALLLLLFVVMLTAWLLAGALARPIGRLREGLEAAARGRYQGVDPTGTRDEIGELVQAFNRMQEQLAESRRKLAQQERQLAWREMARQVAHEIKNPLTPMKLSVQHLRRAFDEEQRATAGDGAEEPADEAKAKRFTGMFDRITATLLEQIDALKRIADEFHSFARLPTRVLEPLDLGTVIREAAALMQEEETAEITLRLHNTPLILEADREELRRIYINLIKNAIQAIPENRPGRIEVTTTREDGADDEPGWAYSTIKDNGSGIPTDVSASIFEPNFSTKTSGTGLGLAIVKKGIEDLSGEIGFETEADVGTTFHVRLPLSE